MVSAGKIHNTAFRRALGYTALYLERHVLGSCELPLLEFNLILIALVNIFMGQNGTGVLVDRYQQLFALLQVDSTDLCGSDFFFFFDIAALSV